MNRYLLFLIIPFYVSLQSSCKDEEPIENLTEFDRTYGTSGNDVGQAIIKVNNSLFLVGTSGSQGNAEIILIKTDLDGNTIWQQNIGGSGDQSGASIICDSNNNLIIAGSSNEKLLLLKTTLEGSVIWQTHANSTLNQMGSSVLEVNDGYLICGTQNGTDRDVLLSKFSLNGEFVWTKTYGEAMNEGASQLLQTPDGNILIYGYTESQGAGNRDLWLLKTSMNGDSISSATFGGSGYEESQEMVMAPSGGYVLCGHSSSQDPNHNLYIVKVSENLQLQWEHHFGSNTQHDGGEAITIDEFSNIYALGRSNGTPNNNEDAYLVKLRPDGLLLSETRFGGELNNRGNAILTTETSIYALGSTETETSGEIKLWLVKMPK